MTAPEEFEGRLRRETGEARGLFRFEVAGEPMSKSRARFAREGAKVRTYTPSGVTEAQAAVAWAFRAAWGKPAVPNDRDGWGVACVFHVEKRQRRDTDNMIKLVCDALTGVVWGDDSQVTEVSGRTVHGSDRPRTIIEVYLTDDLPDRQRRTCEGCGDEFRTYASWDRKTTCNRQCTALVTARRKQRTCAGCGGEFQADRPGRDQAYCSVECKTTHKTVELTCAVCGVAYSKPRSLHRRNCRTYCSVPCRDEGLRNRRKVGAAGSCDACGGPTTKKTYIRCQACRTAGRVPA